MPLPYVAIAMPVYNGAAYMREALDSLLKQTFTDWRLAINNNLSTDETKAIALEYAAKDDRIEYFENDVFVPAITNFNLAFSRPLAWKPTYIKLIAADDWLYPEYLEKMIAVLDRYPSAGYCAAFRLDDKHVNCTGLDVYHGQLFDGKKRFIEEMTDGPWVIGNISTLLYRLSTLQKLARFPMIFDESDYHADTELGRDLLEVADMGYVYTVLSYTRRHNETVTSAIYSKKTQYCSSYNSLYTRKAKYPELEPAFKNLKRFYAWLLITLYIRNRAAFNWHQDHMKRKLTFSDYLEGIWFHNPVGRVLVKIFGRFF